MAHYVFCWGVARGAAGVGSSRRTRAAALAAKRRSRSLLADLASIRDPFFERNAPQNDSEFLVHAGFHLRLLGGNGVRSCRGDGACGSGGPSGPPGGATRFARDHVSFLRDDFGLPGHAVARGKTRPARGLGIFFHADAGLHRAYVWKSLLSRGGRASLVLSLPFLSRLWRRQFFGLHAMAAGAVPDGMPGQRFRLLHVLRAIWRRVDHLSGRRRRSAFSIAGNSRRADVHRLRHWFAPHSLRHGNPWADPAGVDLPNS